MRKKETAINSIIGEDTLISGNIKLDGNLLIYGKVEGNIETGGLIRIASGAEIQGNLIGKELQIGGNIVGDVVASGKVTLGDQSDLKGDIRASQIVIEDGARFEGKCDMISSIDKEIS